MKYVQEKHLGEVVVLAPTRSLFGDDCTDELREAIERLDAERNRHLVVNLQRVDAISTMGLEALLRGHQLYTARGAHMKICHLRERVLAILAIVRLVSIFDCYTTEEEAIASFVRKDDPLPARLDRRLAAGVESDVGRKTA